MVFLAGGVAPRSFTPASVKTESKPASELRAEVAGRIKAKTTGPQAVRRDPRELLDQVDNTTVQQISDYMDNKIPLSEVDLPLNEAGDALFAYLNTYAWREDEFEEKDTPRLVIKEALVDGISAAEAQKSWTDYQVQQAMQKTAQQRATDKQIVTSMAKLAPLAQARGQALEDQGSRGQCAMGVRQSLMAMGYTDFGSETVKVGSTQVRGTGSSSNFYDGENHSAYKVADVMAKDGRFTEITGIDSRNNAQLDALPAGAILVWSAGDNPAGHIATQLGDGTEAYDRVSNRVRKQYATARVFVPNSVDGNNGQPIPIPPGSQTMTLERLLEITQAA